jgi:trigger factor
MNISLINNDTTSGIVRMVIEKNDYEAQVKKQLIQYRQKAHIPGFRTGMAPMGMIKKLYGKYATAEEVNNCVVSNLPKYLEENNLKYLIDPLPNETEQKPVDFDTQDEFEFYFDIAFTPQFNIKLNKRDKVPYYKINVDDKVLQTQMDSYRKNFGSYDQVNEAGAADLVNGTLSELDENNTPKADGIVQTEAMLMPQYLTGKKEQSKFIGAKLDDVIVFNPYKAFKGDADKIAPLLKIDKELVPGVKSNFRFEVKEITRYREAELNQELFDKICGADVVHSEEDLKERIKLKIDNQLKSESEYKLQTDLQDLLIKKAGEVAFAEDLLKRWMLSTKKDYTPELVNENFPDVLAELKFRLIKEEIVRTFNLAIEEADIKIMAKQIALEQLAQYGVYSASDEWVESYATTLMKQEESLNSIAERAQQDKLVEWLKQQVKIETIEVSYDEFVKLLA